MSLWGTKDDKNSPGTITVYQVNSTVVGSSTIFADSAGGARVGDYIIVDTTNQHLRITEITNNTTVSVVAGTVGEHIVTANAAAYSLTEKPVYVSMYNVGANVGQGAANVFGVSAYEVRANAVNAGVQHAGWVKQLVSPGPGGVGTRYRYETLVATKRIVGDAADDSAFVDFYARFTTQPSAQTADLSANASATAIFTVAYEVEPSWANSFIFWQQNTNHLLSTWANISNGANYSGVGTVTLTVVSPAGKNNYSFRAVVGSNTYTSGQANIISNAANLIVIPVPAP